MRATATWLKWLLWEICASKSRMIDEWLLSVYCPVLSYKSPNHVTETFACRASTKSGLFFASLEPTSWMIMISMWEQQRHEKLSLQTLYICFMLFAPASSAACCSHLSVARHSHVCVFASHLTPICGQPAHLSRHITAEQKRQFHIWFVHKILSFLCVLFHFTMCAACWSHFRSEQMKFG